MKFLSVTGMLHKPKGITLNWYRPFFVTKAVFGLSFGSNSTCQYPKHKCKVENHCVPNEWSSNSSMFGKGYVSLTVKSFNFQ